MAENFRVALSGYGRVHDLVSELIESGLHPITAVSAAGPLDGFADVWVNCEASYEDTNEVLSIISSGVPVILSSKVLVHKSCDVLASTARNFKNKIYLNSVFASKEKTKYGLMNISEKNILSFEPSEYLNIQSDDESVASYIYQDLLRAYNKWDPTYEQSRKEKESLRREALKQNLYSVAKKLNVELESQPCGIDPKLPESAANVSTSNK